MKNLYSLLIILLFSTTLFAQCGAAFRVNADPFNTYGVILTDMSIANTISPTLSVDYGDGSLQTDTLSHVYAFPGIYRICFTMTEPGGCTNTICKNVSVPFISGIFIRDFADSSQASCTAPALQSMSYDGYLTGSITDDSVHCHIYFGDGADSTFVVISSGNPSSSYWTAYHTYSVSGTYYPWLIVSNSNNFDTAYCNPIYVRSGCGTYSGVVFIDNNNDCIYNSGDVPAENQYLEIFNNGAFIRFERTDSIGRYSFSLPTGVTYDIKVSPSSLFTNHQVPSCPASGIISVSNPSANNNLGLVCAPGFDLTGYAYSWGIRPGATNAFIDVSVYNNRCLTPSGQVDVTLDPLLTPFPDPSYTINGQTITFPINPGEYDWRIRIPVSVSTSAIINDSVCVQLSIQPVIDDSVPSNNYQTACFRVSNSCDPNEKHVSPEGVGISGLISPQQQLSYVIYFQNTGSADAINIYMLDTLSLFLKPESIHVTGASHDMYMSLFPGNVLRFDFQNINLPDSNNNEKLSHGYVAFTIDQIDSNANGTVIPNFADIFFDYNQPVITNTTVNTIDATIGIDENVNRMEKTILFPVPSNEFVNVVFDSSKKRIISIYDVAGTIVKQIKSNDSKCRIEITDLENGYYFLKTNSSEKGFKMVVIHN